MNSKHVADTKDREITLSRVLDAPCELVWKAWTEPEHLIKWWGPNGFTNTFHEISVTPGGVWSFIMHGPDGVDYPNHIVFEEVVKPERLVFSHAESEDDPNSFQSVVTFEENDGKTTVTMHSVFKTIEAREYVIKEHGAIEGGKQTLGKLAAYVATM